jgi:hypothetical protein
MKLFRTFLIISILALLYSSCAKEENYSDIPNITFNSFTPFCSGSTNDSAYLRINFTDGTGDIGYPLGDASVPPDFFIVPMYLNIPTGTYDTIIYQSPYTGNDTTLSYGYLIPDITPSGKDKELNGIIQINLENALQIISSIPPISGKNFNKLEFKVWIYDRAGNKSNILITPPCPLCGN